jgi:hypothetical protein
MRGSAPRTLGGGALRVCSLLIHTNDFAGAAGRFLGTQRSPLRYLKSWSASQAEQPHWRALIGANMETILIIVVVVLLLGGGGWYGRGRWY